MGIKLKNFNWSWGIVWTNIQSGHCSDQHISWVMEESSLCFMDKSDQNMSENYMELSQQKNRLFLIK